MSTRTDYIARTSLGVTIATFESRDQAVTWAEIEGPKFPGWSIAAVTEQTIVTTRVLRRDRSHLKVVQCA